MEVCVPHITVTPHASPSVSPHEAPVETGSFRSSGSEDEAKTYPVTHTYPVGSHVGSQTYGQVGGYAPSGPEVIVHVLILVAACALVVWAFARFTDPNR